MNAPQASGDDRTEAILEAWFAARHAGTEPDLDVLCGGDPGLAARVRSLLERHAALLDDGEEKANGRREPFLVEQLGDYRLKARLGSGGMGEVFLARQKSLDRLVALKVLRPELASDPVRRLRFRREAEITAALDHPNIVPVFETGEQDGAVFIAMKLLDGATLEQLPRPWQPRPLAAVGARVANALHAAHEVGVVHRDVKPANVLMVGEHPYVLDFGLARARVDLSLTGAGHVPGTLRFMAPEQLQGGPAALDPRVDVYALGATLYSCLAGRAPFPDEQPEVLVRRILVQDPPPIGGPASQRDLETIVMRALDKEPARRFPTALEMAEDLERFAGGFPIRSRPAGLGRRAVKLVRRHRAAAAVLAAGLLAVSLLGILLLDSVLEQRATRTRLVERVQQDLTRGAHASALAGVVELERRGETEPDVGELRRRTETLLARDGLLDQLQADRRYLDTASLRRADQSLEGGHPEVLGESRTALARMLLAFYRGDPVAAWLGDSRIALDFPRTRAAVAAAVEDRDPVASLAATGHAVDRSLASEDHAFAAAVLRVAEQSLDAIGAELRGALAHDAENPRVLFGQALLLALRGEREQAEFLLSSLLRDGVPRPEVHVMLARLAAKRGDFDESHRQLRAADDALRINGLGRPMRRVLAELEVYLQQGRFDMFDSCLEEARAGTSTGVIEEWRDSALLLVMEGYSLVLRGRRTGARACFEQAVEMARLPWNARRARGALSSLEIQQIGEETDPVVLREKIPLLFTRAAELRKEAAAAHDEVLEAEARVDLAYLYLQSGQLANVHREVRAALELAHDNPDANYLFVYYAYELIPEDWIAIDDPDLTALGREAMQRARKLVERQETRPVALPRAKVAEVLTLATVIATALNDREFAGWAGGRASAMDEVADRADLVGALAGCLGRLGWSYWPKR